MTEFKAVRGMRDLLPAEAHHWRQIEQVTQDCLNRFGYLEIRLPLLEFTELFVQSAGLSTDLVQKEMYTFADRNAESLSLRPEGTASCIRAALERRLLANNQSARLWYGGPMFRYERPQKGRYRQFEQIGAEAIGFPGPDIDAELLALNWRTWQALGIADEVTLQLNTLGTAPVREAYREALVAYLRMHEDQLDETSVMRLEVNPLRILDSKVPQTLALLTEAPVLTDFLDAESSGHFNELQRLLEGLDVPFTVNPHIVRGLDYYTKTVFEWTSEKLGAQNAFCSGGRYDDLVGLLGGKSMPAVGFALGMDRLALLVQETQFQNQGLVDVYIVPLTDEFCLEALKLAHQLRCELPAACILCHAGGGKIKARMKQAHRSGAQVALLLGEQEVHTGGAMMKPLRTDTEQHFVALAQLATSVAAVIDTPGVVGEA